MDSGTLARMFRVLVVDDDADINEVVREGLRSAGYDAVGALTGAEALAEVDRQCPDLVLLDQMLPDIDGVEICRRLREAPDTRRVPIMFLTAMGGSEARVRGLALGADDYVVKPFSMRELILRVGAVLRRATPVEMHLPPEWIRLRDQFRVWNRYADIHLARGEWRDCLELSRSILHNCDGVLSPDERRRIFERIARCAKELGDAETHKTSQGKSDTL
jgi:two-component system, OmpR family, phosphate regulon response regulator PhoB